MNIQLSHSQERSNVTGNIGAEDNMEILELQWPRLLAKIWFVSTINFFAKSDQYQYLGNCPPIPPLTEQ